MGRLNVILDSGAYTAWQTGKSIDLKAYIDFIKRHEEWITHAICLDVIGPGNPEEAASQSMLNYKIMRKAGLHPMPVLHIGEDLRWLKEMLDLGADYIGLAASSSRSRSKTDEWYNLVWQHLISPSGLPLVRCHAFGEGREKAIVRNPWFSADCAGWIYKSQRAGTFKLGDIEFSHRTDKHTTNAIRDIETLEGSDKIELEKLVRELGVNPEALMRNTEVGFLIRTYLEAKRFMNIQKRVSAKCPIRKASSGFFRKAFLQGPGLSIPSFNMHLVIGINKYAYAVAAMIPDVKNVLTSFAHINNDKAIAKNKFREYFADPQLALIDNPALHKYSNMIKEYIHG